jgi:hypothetical protein
MDDGVPPLKNTVGRDGGLEGQVHLVMIWVKACQVGACRSVGVNFGSSTKGIDRVRVNDATGLKDGLDRSRAAVSV